ncbi:RING finger protein 4 isoform X1 [Astyanax mexicanus]|uniref:RING finger protein 4 isoform X1 n=2 Tax=Astyanax mexicanus TaxID=7994 RepID=UPI0020CAA0F2|nr:RING finger protein 4 isoform X1 [Astyanax mexicanus]
MASKQQESVVSWTCRNMHSFVSTETQLRNADSNIEVLRSVCAQRKRRSTSSCSRRNNKRTRTQTVMETIDVLESDRLSSEEVVDLTCEASEPAVVDLTNNDSVVLVEEGTHSRRGQGTESYVLSSDEDEEPSLNLNPAVLSSLRASSTARSTPGAVSCPVCMDAYAEIIESGRLMVSTKCGHLFCSQCIRDSLARAHSCPTCRKKLTHKQYHPIYI